MANRSLEPFRPGSLRPFMADPFSSFRRQMDQLFDDFFAPMERGARPLPAMKLPRLVDAITTVDRSVRIGTVPLLGSVEL